MGNPSGASAFYPVYANQGPIPSEEDLIAQLIAERGGPPMLPQEPMDDPFQHMAPQVAQVKPKKRRKVVP